MNADLNKSLDALEAQFEAEDQEIEAADDATRELTVYDGFGDTMVAPRDGDLDVSDEDSDSE